MRPRSLTGKVVLVSFAILVLFAILSLDLLYYAQRELAVKEMDLVLASESAALSNLITVKENGALEYDLKNTRWDAGFAVFQDGVPGALKTSGDPPAAGCDSSNSSRTQEVDGRLYRLRAYRYLAEVDDEVKEPTQVKRPWLCLLLALDQSPYLAQVDSSVRTVFPVLMTLLLAFFFFVLWLVLNVTRDLSQLSDALAKGVFSGSYQFPELPQPRTPEVQVVVQRLRELHLQATNAYQEVWVFLGRASHQMKTPVTALLATLDVLLRKERTREELLEELQNVRAGARHLSTLTQKLISSARASFDMGTETREIEIEGFVQEQLRTFQALATEKSLHLEAALTPFMVVTNPYLLAELVGNLLENAIMYTPAGGRVLIHGAASETQYRLTVRDTGPGFPSRVRENLFQPFIRGDERKAYGSGLGLSIAKKAADLLGVTLALNQSSSSGTELEIVFRTSRK